MDRSAIEAIGQLAVAAHHDLNGIADAVIIPEGTKVQNLESLRPTPAHFRAEMKTNHLAEFIRILPHEDASQWQTVPHTIIKGHRMLAHKPNGECIYLGATGCNIHGNAPQQCRQMDCRTLANRITYTQARKLNLPIAVLQRGKELLRVTK